MRAMRLLTPVLVLGMLTGPALGEEGVKLDDPTARASYSLGHQIGQDLKRQGVTLDRPAMLRGLADGQSEAEPLMSQEEINTLLAALKQKIVTQVQQERKAKVDAMKQAGMDFLAANKDKPGVQTTESGLQYKVIEPGKGRQPGATDKVRVHYRGRTIEGREFDSSHKRGQPAEFALNGVIRGWSEGLQLMKEGARYELYIPWNLAYSARGPLAYQTLVFEVELLAVNPQETAKAGTAGGSK